MPQFGVKQLFELFPWVMLLLICGRNLFFTTLHLTGGPMALVYIAGGSIAMGNAIGCLFGRRLAWCAIAGCLWVWAFRIAFDWQITF